MAPKPSSTWPLSIAKKSCEEISIKELAESMIRLAGSRSIVKYMTQAEVYGPSYEDIRRRVPSIKKMRQILGIEPQVPLDVGLQRTIEWFRQSVR
jgi:nucleoside-diphosphate-sugar epimerase